MPSLSQLLFLAPALLAAVQAQGIITKAVGTKGSNVGLGLQVSQTAADANIIRPIEITQNIVNECGRTLLAGNIDIGTITEAQLTANAVTSVVSGGTVDVTIAQGGADGAGPYTCDMDQTSNSLGSGQTKLQVAEKAPVNGNIVLTITMPDDLACVGASTGDICTIRCFNAAAAGPFGGCIPVQQTDETPTINEANAIDTAQTKEGIDAQVAQNIKDLDVAIDANQRASLDEQGLFAAEALLTANPPAATATAAPAAATGAARTGKGRKGANRGGAATGATRGGAAAGGAATGATRGGAATGGAATGATRGGATRAGNGAGRGNRNNKRVAQTFSS